jgi:flagella basal body P-ring formation protein FlgA
MRSHAGIESYIKTTANFDNAINDIKKILVLVLEQELKDADKDSNTIIEEITSRRRNISNLVEETKNDIALNNSERTSVEICSSQLKYSEKHITLKIEFIL